MATSATPIQLVDPVDGTPYSAKGSIASPGIIQAVGDRQVVVYTTFTMGAGTAYAVGQNLGGSKTIAVGIGNNTPFAISAMLVAYDSTGLLNAGAPNTFVNILGAAPTGTYTDGSAAIISPADQLATIRSGNVVTTGNNGGSSLYAAQTLSGYKSLGSGVTDATGNIYINLSALVAITPSAAVTVLVKLTLHY